jgi:threonyl-tRNA synthetase
VVGDKERQNDTVSVRARGNRNLGVMPVADFISKVVTEDRERVNGDQQ